MIARVAIKVSLNDPDSPSSSAEKRELASATHRKKPSSRARPRTLALLRQTDHDGPPPRQLLLGNFRREFQLDPQPPALLPRRLVEKVNHISAKPFFHPPPRVKIK